VVTGNAKGDEGGDQPGMLVKQPEIANDEIERIENGLDRDQHRGKEPAAICSGIGFEAGVGGDCTKESGCVLEGGIRRQG
jgi:hypothetical protein